MVGYNYYYNGLIEAPIFLRLLEQWHVQLASVYNDGPWLSWVLVNKKRCRLVVLVHGVLEQGVFGDTH
jgi:hypothetical protein